jgi:alpha/beta superfamily hydrolase
MRIVRLTKTLDIDGSAGRLEALLMVPRHDPVAAAVVCHAHPLYGGTMQMKVVYRAAKTLQNHRLIALRFNFRGVGRSQGSHDDGRGEQEDVRSVLDEMERLFPGLPLVLGGFSFGSTMALEVGLADPQVKALFALGFPVSLVPDTSFLDVCTKPRLFVQCEKDPFGSGDEMRDLVEKLPQPRELVVVPGGDHLFTERIAELDEALGNWIAHHPWGVRGCHSEKEI